jgi:hypothetical protein
MLKSRVIYEGAQTGLYIVGGHTRLQGAPAGNDCQRALVAHAVACVRPLVKVRPRWARMRANGRGQVGPGTDWWERARIPGADAWVLARTRGIGRELFAYLRLRAQTLVNGRGRVGPGANTMSSCERKAIRAQPLRWRHVSGRGRVRHRARARTGVCCRGGGHKWLPKGRTRLRGWEV